MKRAGGSTAGAENLGQTAVKLSQGPLGIIALFIVLIHGFASLVLGVGQHITGSDRSVLVWFLALFPVVVLATFAVLVSTCHEKLYPPGAFRREENFLAALFGRASFDQQATQSTPRDRPTAAVNAVRKSATASLYWLGHDLMWTADTLLRQGPREDVIRGLDQAMHHLVHAGLHDTAFERDLQALHAQIQSSMELLPGLRDGYASKIGSIIDKVGATLEAAQGDFQVPPHWSRVRT